MLPSDRARWTVGVDEAGYGPNLGPLVVVATAWRGPADTPLESALAPALAADVGEEERLVIADSKSVYKPGGGLAALERAVYAATGAPTNWRGWLAQLGVTADATPPPWRQGYDPPLPIHADLGQVEAGRRRLAAALGGARFAPPIVAARVVGAEEFNRLIARHGTKGAALSHLSIGLARRVYERAADPHADWRFVFDKHGGRNRYAGLLQDHFPDHWVQVRQEGRAESAYQAGERLGFRFRTKGESEPAVALASMTAKLVREVEMLAFNAFWRRRLPDLRPTAGYPVDARRFKAEIAAAQTELGIADAALWRER
ncbi:hypothetical protein [Botrimarina sp.]|uniref:hypothetical protein n=1 Tax=Botrimarina sp. TaxID=2795802 RepID=UPI0032EF15A5